MGRDSLFSPSVFAIGKSLGVQDCSRPQGPPQTCTSAFTPNPQGRTRTAQALRCLRQGRLQSVSDCRGKALSKQKPPSGSKALCFIPAYGRSSAPAAPALRLSLGRALRARPHGGRLAVRDADSDRGSLRAAVFFLLQRYGSAILYQGLIPLGSLSIRAIVSPIGESSFYQYDHFGR